LRADFGRDEANLDDLVKHGPVGAGSQIFLALCLQLLLFGFQLGPVLQVGTAVKRTFFLLFHVIGVRIDAVGAFDANWHGEEVVAAEVLGSAGLGGRFEGGRGGVAMGVRATVRVGSAVGATGSVGVDCVMVRTGVRAVVGLTFEKSVLALFAILRV
jgi:hypothetical protein